MNVKTLIIGRSILGIMDWNYEYEKRVIELLTNNCRKLKESNNRYIFELFPKIPNTVKRIGIKTWKKKIMIDVG